MVRSRNFVYPLLNVIEDKVPVDVAISLVVNHINIDVLYCLSYVYAYVYD